MSRAEAGLRDQLRLQVERLRAEGVWGLARPADPAVATAESAESQTAVTVTETAPTPASSAGSAPQVDVRPTTAAAPSTVEPSGRVEPPGPTVIEGAPESLETIAAEIRGCTACRLCEERTHTVPGVGDPRARLMFIGEGPGREEDRRGEPFVGAAGAMLDRIIEAMGLKRPQVYIANAVKCRPPQNRNPLPDELATCRPFLMRQIALVRPEMIVLLGRVAAQSVLGRDEPLGRLRGRFLDLHGIPVMCTYHPAYLLRNPADKRKTWEDIQQVMTRLGLEGR